MAKSLALSFRCDSIAHSRALQLRGGGRRHLETTQTVSRLAVQKNTSEKAAGSCFLNATESCTNRIDGCSMLPGAARRAEMAHRAGPPARLSLKKRLNRFIWKMSDWLGITGTSTSIKSKFVE